MVLSFFGLLLLGLTVLGARRIHRLNQGTFYRRIVEIADLEGIQFPAPDLTDYKKKWFFEYGFCEGLVENRTLQVAALSLIEQESVLILEPGTLHTLEPDTDHKIKLALHLSEELQNHGAREIVLHGATGEYLQGLTQSARVEAIAIDTPGVILLIQRINKKFSDWQPLREGKLFRYARP